MRKGAVSAAETRATNERLRVVAVAMGDESIDMVESFPCQRDEVSCWLDFASPAITPNAALNLPTHRKAPLAVYLPRTAEAGIDARAYDVQAGYGEPLHVHPHEALLIYAEAGAYTLFTDDRVWALLPSRSLWLPAGVPSGWQAGARAPVRLRPLHFPLPLPADLPSEPKVVGVSPLLGAVIDELRRLHEARSEGDVATVNALRQVALHEIRKTTDTTMPSVPQPSHAGLRRVTAMQLADLAVEWPLAACADTAHMSVRSFCRYFPQEVNGLTWPAWVRQARMMVGRQLIELGTSVNQAAAQVGYDSQSAFAAAYRRLYGESPSAHATVGRG